MQRSLLPSRRPKLTRILLAALGLTAVVAGGVVIFHRIAQVQQGAIVQVPRGVTRDPATRARGAVVSLSGQDSHPRATYDPASGTVSVAFQSRYYDPTHTVALNRQYLATEGRLAVQLVLHTVPEASRVVVDLYRGRQKLAGVTGTHGEAYDAYAVEYARGLP